MPWTEANGVVLHYALDGPEDGKPLVLVHELGGSLHSWQPAMPRVAPAGFRALRWDWRGTGLSEKIRGELSVDTMCADLAALLDALKFPQPVNLAGTALGGGVALAFAAREPERVRKLAVSSPAIGGRDGLEQMLRARADEAERGGMRPLVETSLARSYPEKYRSDRMAFAAYRCRWIANDPASFASHNRMLAAMDETPNLGRIACPALVLSGTDDPLLTPAMMKPIADAISGAEYKELPTGHFLAVNSPELWAEEVLPFFHD